MPTGSTHLTQVIKEKGEKGNMEVGRGCGDVVGNLGKGRRREWIEYS